MQERHVKILGLALIFIGLALSLFTFYQAYTYLKSPYPSPDLPETSGSSGQPDINRAIAQAVSPFLPLAFSTSYLFIMGLIGFWILGRGIQLVK